MYYIDHRALPSEFSNKTFSTKTGPIVKRPDAIKYRPTLAPAEITLSDTAQHLPELNTCMYAETQFFIFGQDFKNCLSHARRTDFASTG